MASSKGTGVTRLGRDSRPKYLGIKLFEGQTAKQGQILVRQRGTKFFPGENVRRGGDDTLYAIKGGVVRFASKTKRGFDNSLKKVKIVSVE